jgi:protein MpaA
VAAFFALLCLGASPAWSGADERIEFGVSVEGRGLRAHRIGSSGAERTVLVIGSFHGDETQGHEIVRGLRDETPEGAAIWLVESVNPDGVASQTRKNANGVDLNRNFSAGWERNPDTSSGYFPGPRPFSEPESRAVRRLVRQIDPDLAIFYHQPWNQVLGACHGADHVQRRYAKLAAIEFACRGGELPGTATKWFNRKDGRRAFVVELGGGKFSATAANRHIRAVLATARAR